MSLNSALHYYLKWILLPMITYETTLAQTQINIATSLKEMYEREL